MKLGVDANYRIVLRFTNWRKDMNEMPDRDLEPPEYTERPEADYDEVRQQEIDDMNFDAINAAIEIVTEANAKGLIEEQVDKGKWQRPLGGQVLIGADPIIGVMYRAKSSPREWYLCYDADDDIMVCYGLDENIPSYSNKILVREVL
jgi:hypothetical protein